MYDDALGLQPEKPRWVIKAAPLDKQRKEILQRLNFLLHRMEGRHFAARQVQTAK